MDLIRHLSFFVAVAEHRHFGNAAASLSMAQPPLSQGIQRLERHLGQRLFDRDARRVSLTPAGAALLPRAREFVYQAESFVVDARHWSGRSAARVGLATDLEQTTSRVLTALTEAGIALEPRFAGSNELLGQVRDGDLDVALVRHPSVVDGLLAGEVLAVDGALDVGGLADGLPVALPPRRNHPAAHDQLIDSLRRLGYDNSIKEIELYQERQSWIDARLACGVRLEMTPASTSAHVTLRFRVVAPVLSMQRSGVDHARLSDVIESALR